MLVGAGCAAAMENSVDVPQNAEHGSQVTQQLHSGHLCRENKNTNSTRHAHPVCTQHFVVVGMKQPRCPSGRVSKKAGVQQTLGRTRPLPDWSLTIRNDVQDLEGLCLVK